MCSFTVFVNTKVTKSVKEIVFCYYYYCYCCYYQVIITIISSVSNFNSILVKNKLREPRRILQLRIYTLLTVYILL